MNPVPIMEISYFPGCSLATTARESNESLVLACEALGLRLAEIEDWNCCGSSSAHSLDPELALGLCARNLALAPPDRPLLTMCPSCFRNLLSARRRLRDDPEFRRSQERRYGRVINPDLEIVTFLEILHFLDRLRSLGSVPGLEVVKDLAGLRVAPYYGCMGMFPPPLRRDSLPPDLMDRPLCGFGAEVLIWPHRNRCCGTFLSAARPDVVTPLVNEIIQGAIRAGAECIVTACAMCQLNLEIRGATRPSLPILHFSELMALVLGAGEGQRWFNRHLVDPRPLLREKKLI
ncbi:MAG: heterodisulfide reductase-related iron-sulfur binding cluster [Thermodesulfobacteriota bacterium]